MCPLPPTTRAKGGRERDMEAEGEVVITLTSSVLLSFLLRSHS